MRTLTITHFQHPAALLLFIFVFIVIFLYIWMGKKHDKALLNYAHKSNWDILGLNKRRIFRIIPSILAMLSLAALIIAAAGPIGRTLIPRSRATLVVAFDISRSMQAHDLEPSRLQVAKNIVKRLLDSLGSGISVGLVTFDSSAAGVVNPTTNHSTIISALDAVKLGDGTATGAAINEARRMIQKYNTDLGGTELAETAQVLMISDGKQTAPTFDPDTEGGCYVAARAAASENIPINTIAIGTDNASIEIDGDTIPVPVDETALTRIAGYSGGRTFSASNIGILSQILGQLVNHIGYEKREQPYPLPLEYFALLTLVSALILGIGVNRHVF